MLSSDPFWFDYRFLLKFPPGLHRLVTSFMVTQPQIGVLMDTYFAFSYLSQLEKSNSKFSKKEDLIWYLIVVGAVVIVGYTQLSLCLARLILHILSPSYIRT